MLLCLVLPGKGPQLCSPHLSPFPRQDLGSPILQEPPQPPPLGCFEGGLPTGLKYSSKFHLFPRGSCSSRVPAWDQWPQALGSEKAQTQSLLDLLPWSFPANHLGGS